jgi:flagellar basal-body rod modification protein FlgD
VSTIGSTTPLGASDPAKDTPTTSQSKNNRMGKDAFLQLLVTQMSHQNPLQPQDDGAFIAQLAQFSSLEQLTSIDDTLAGMATVMGVDLTKISSSKTSSSKTPATK